MLYKLCWSIVILIVLSNCSRISSENPKYTFQNLEKHIDLLDYTVTPNDKFDKSGLMFSDQGAWFAYSFPNSVDKLGFTGPFLLTQENGVWSSEFLAHLSISGQKWNKYSSKTYHSHLEQSFYSKDLEVFQQLVFLSGHTAIIKSTIKNISDKVISIETLWKNNSVMADSLHFDISEKELKIISVNSDAIGHLIFPEKLKLIGDNQYETETTTFILAPQEIKSISISQSFIFPEYSWEEEKAHISRTNFTSILFERKKEKEEELNYIFKNLRTEFERENYPSVIAKSLLTLQNNWRIPAGEIKYEGLFPSYHYKWFNGFWSWDSWKHAVAISYYNPELAKNQIKQMFEFQTENGFVADCVYRDTTIEAHNYRNTKPPLSAWAVSKIYERNNDLEFLEYMYPKLIAYHNWWYVERDHDKDKLCEYGSTDGSLIAAKWESGMDNAIRFDNTKILENGPNAYSMDQESIDLNAYLYAEKLYLSELAKILGETNDQLRLQNESKTLKSKIRSQFYDEADGWFYDTTIDGLQFIKGEGSEGWTALWAKAASQEQATAVKTKMMDSTKFYTKVPFQTMSADHPKFNPENGYWRGPNWLDQSYFGVIGLRNYGFENEANQATSKIIEGAEGILTKGAPIRENYHPITGKGLYSKNFSWSAAHLIMLLTNEHELRND